MSAIGGHKIERALDNVLSELDEPLTNRGFLLGCALIAEAIDWTKFKEGNDEEVEGLTTTFQRVCKVFRDYR